MFFVAARFFCFGRDHQRLQKQRKGVPSRLWLLKAWAKLQLGKFEKKDPDKNYKDTPRQSGLPKDLLPKHVAIIMDGNRRYGMKVIGNSLEGHKYGSKTALQLTEWADTEGIEHLTLFGFSSENWSRAPDEVNCLMELALNYMYDIRPLIFNRQIRFKHLCSSESNRLPPGLANEFKKLAVETQHFTGMTLNVCFDYGAREEILSTCRNLAEQCATGQLKASEITNDLFSSRLTTGHCGCDPDVLIRTSGEERLSNFLLWQIAYTELFFLDKTWPEMEKIDLLEILWSYAKGRERRFGR